MAPTARRKFGVPICRTWGLLEANVLYCRKYLWHFWDFSASPRSHPAPPAVISRSHSDSAPEELCSPCPSIVTTLYISKQLASYWQKCIECASFFGHRRNYFLNDRKILSQFGHNVRKGRLVQSSKWASFRSPNPARVRNHKPEPGPSPEFIYEARFRPETKFAELVRICATAGYQKRSLRVYLCKHTVLSYPR